MNNGVTAIIDLIFGIGIPALLVLVGVSVGRIVESRHFKRLDAREADLKDFLVTDIKTFPGGADPSAGATLVTSEAAISADYFKSLLASIRNIFGGELRSYKNMMDRARREALCRLLERAREAGYNAVCNVRLETADIAGSQQRKAGVVMVCIVASGTAYRAAGAPAARDGRATAAAAGIV